MLCTISGSATSQPVASVKTGHVYDRSLLEKHLDERGTCPATGAASTKDDYIKLQVGLITPAKPPQATSIPSLLKYMQDEWDSVMLECHELRRTLITTREDLALSLTRSDACEHELAKLLQERDGLRDALLDTSAKNAQLEAEIAKHGTSQSMEVEEQRSLLDEAAKSHIRKEIRDYITDCSEKLTQQRRITNKSRKGERKTTLEPAKARLASLNLVKSLPNLHSPTVTGLTSLAVHPLNSDCVIIGGMDKMISLVDLAGATDSAKAASVLHKFNGHEGPVTDLAFGPATSETVLLYSASRDKTVRVWSNSGENTYTLAHTLAHHFAEVSGISVHPSGFYMATASLDGNWALVDVVNGGNVVMMCKANKDLLRDGFVPGGFSAITLHPDGHLVGTGMARGPLQLWDVRDREPVAMFKNAHTDRVQRIAFSENGYHMATAGADGVVKLWDIRESGDQEKACIHSFDLPGAQCVSFDTSGDFLVMAGDVLSVACTVKPAGLLAALMESTHPTTRACFAPDGSYVLCAGMDRSLSVYS